MATQEPERRNDCPTEDEIGALSPWAQVALAARAAMRVLPAAGVAGDFAVWGNGETGFKRVEAVEAAILVALVTSVEGAFSSDLPSLAQAFAMPKSGEGPAFAVGAAQNLVTAADKAFCAAWYPIEQERPSDGRTCAGSKRAQDVFHCCCSAAKAAWAAVMHAGSAQGHQIEAEATEARVCAAMRHDLTDLMSTMAPGGCAVDGRVPAAFFDDRPLWESDQIANEWVGVIMRWLSALAPFRQEDAVLDATRWSCQGCGISYCEAVDQLKSYATRLQGDTA